MNWIAAHVVMYVKFKSAGQRHFPIWENIVLVQARSEKLAFAKAEKHGRLAEGDEGRSFRWGGQPAKWVFAGVRKLTECESPDERPTDGTEVSYSEFEVESQNAIDKLAAGETVQVQFEDRSNPVVRNGHASSEINPAKRKRA